MNTFLDQFFLYSHLLWTLFNLFGWIWKKTRRLHLILITITFLSWFGLGIIYGIGYCPLTDWHWQVREQLGYTEMPRSYITFIIHYFTGIKISANIAETGTFVAFFLCLGCSLGLNFRDLKRAKD